MARVCHRYRYKAACVRAGLKFREVSASCAATNRDLPHTPCGYLWLAHFGAIFAPQNRYYSACLEGGSSKGTAVFEICDYMKAVAVKSRLNIQDA